MITPRRVDKSHPLDSRAVVNLLKVAASKKSRRKKKPVKKKKKSLAPKSHHLDYRAAVIADLGVGDDDDLLTTRQIAEWFGVTRMWVDIGRSRGYGPQFMEVTPNCILYRRGDVRDWLRERSKVAEAKQR
jgi:hypothetical protein